MKKINYIILFLSIIMLPSITKANTIYGYASSNNTLIASRANVTTNGCLEKKGSSYSSNYASPGNLHCLDSGEKVEITNYNSIIPSTTSTCSNGYYSVKFTTTSGTVYPGYMCADNIKIEVNTSKYAEEFKDFPSSYWNQLALLKELHPNWIFTPYKTNLNWDSAIKAESVVGISYIQSTNPIYLSLDEGSYNINTGKYIQREAGDWYAANKTTVGYYMDPRNFLDEMNIFQFENLGFNSTYQTKSVIDSIFSNTELLPYSTLFYNAATYNGNSVSPVMLAARSKQEVLSLGKLTGSANGASGYYNFFNIGAYSTCSNPVACAIEYAKNKGWSTPELAINGGAKFIGDQYINAGQNTLYFQRYNTTSKNTYNHQYMTNISAAVSEGKSTWNSYKNLDILKNSLNFIIPVYNNMPSSNASLPTKVESIPEISVTVPEISNILAESGYKTDGNYLNNIKLHLTAKDIITNLENKGVKVTVKTIDANGNIKDISSTEKLGTGDIISINNGSTTGEYRVVVNGDVNGDGDVSAVDYVKVKNNIMGGIYLNGSFSKAADVNGDGKISALDYVKIKNFIMGEGSI